MVRDYDLAITFKFYEDSDEGLTQMKYDNRKALDLTQTEFVNTSAIEYPYGKNFEVIIDFTDTKTGIDGITSLNDRKIVEKIYDQIAGSEIELGPSEVEDFAKNYVPPTVEQQKRLSPKLHLVMLHKDIKTEYEVLSSKNNEEEADILNREKMKDEKKIKIKMQRIGPDGKAAYITKSDGSKVPVEVEKEITPGMALWIFDGGEFRKARVSDRLFVLDKRSGEPVNLLYKFI